MADEAPPPDDARPGRVVPVLLVALLLAVAVAGWQWLRANDLASSARERDATVAAAEAFATTMLSYRHDDLDGARDRVAALATDEFARTYATAIAGGLGELIREANATSTGIVRHVFVSPVGDGVARAIVVVDVEVTSDVGRRELTGAYLQLDLIRQSGTWRVNEVVAVSATGEALIPGAD